MYKKKIKSSYGVDANYKRAVGTRPSGSSGAMPVDSSLTALTPHKLYKESMEVKGIF